MMFTEFKETIEDHGATVTDRGNGHWQIKVDKVTLNYYPNSSRGTLFVNAIPGVTSQLRFEKADVNTVLKLVKDFKGKGVTNVSSTNDTEERIESSQ
jgi:hypothetical protein